MVQFFIDSLAPVIRECIGYHMCDGSWGDSDYSHAPIKQLVLNVAVTVFTSRRLVKNCPNPKRIFYSTERMARMPSIRCI